MKTQTSLLEKGNGYNGSIPPTALDALKLEATGLAHGIATLTLIVKDCKLIRYTTSREISVVPCKPMTGGHNGN